MSPADSDDPLVVRRFLRGRFDDVFVPGEGVVRDAGIALGDALAEVVGDPEGVGEPSTAAQVVGVDVRIEDSLDLEAAVGRRLADRFDVAGRVDGGRGAGFGVGDEIAQTALRAPL